MKKQTKQFIVYDVESKPELSEGDGRTLSLIDILQIRRDEGYLFYDSSKGKEPQIIGDDLDVKVFDYNTPEGKELLDRLTSDASS